MNNYHFHLDLMSHKGLQNQLREVLVDAILAGVFSPKKALPSCRKLSEQLDISRNTVALVYESLLDDGYLLSRPRSGYYLHPTYAKGDPLKRSHKTVTNAPFNAPEWGNLVKKIAEEQFSLLKPTNWRSYPYPFIYGQIDTECFPLDNWRKIVVQILNKKDDLYWTIDQIDKDYSELIHQLRTKVLPKRGIIAQEDEILITLGSQNALYLIAQLLFDNNTQVAIENPGYPDMVDITRLHKAHIIYQPVDQHGMIINSSSAAAHYLYVTPSHQVPTGVEMSKHRRDELLMQANQNNQIIIEDDYDAEINFNKDVLPALKASKDNSRIIYLSSFSKSLSPGIRLGYIVADAELIDELRTLRRFMYRHPPHAIQYQIAQFLAQGYYDHFVRKNNEKMKKKWDCMYKAINQYLPECEIISPNNASSIWLKAPDKIDTQRLAWYASQTGVLIEPGIRHYLSAPHKNYLRLGFSAISFNKIDKGIELLANAFAKYDSH